VPVIEFVYGGSIRIDTQHSLDLRDLVNRLYGSNSSCSDRIYLSMSTRCSLVQFDVWSSGAIDHRLQTLSLLLLLLDFLLLSIVTVSIDRINQYNVGWTFNSESYID